MSMHTDKDVAPAREAENSFDTIIFECIYLDDVTALQHMQMFATILLFFASKENSVNMRLKEN